MNEDYLTIFFFIFSKRFICLIMFGRFQQREIQVLRRKLIWGGGGGGGGRGGKVKIVVGVIIFPVSNTVFTRISSAMLI